MSLDNEFGPSVEQAQRLALASYRNLIVKLGRERLEAQSALHELAAAVVEYEKHVNDPRMRGVTRHEMFAKAHAAIERLTPAPVENRQAREDDWIVVARQRTSHQTGLDRNPIRRTVSMSTPKKSTSSKSKTKKPAAGKKGGKAK